MDEHEIRAFGITRRLEREKDPGMRRALRKNRDEHLKQSRTWNEFLDRTPKPVMTGADYVRNSVKPKEIICVETGEIYPSMNDAAVHLGISRSGIGKAIKVGRPIKGYTFKEAK